MICRPGGLVSRPQTKSVIRLRAVQMRSLITPHAVPLRAHITAPKENRPKAVTVGLFYGKAGATAIAPIPNKNRTSRRARKRFVVK